jgi:hypothetical protein
MKIEGKGQHSQADYVSVHTFENGDDALRFIAENNKDGKYWSVAQTVRNGQKYETMQDSF